MYLSPFSTCTNPIIHLFSPPPFCIIIVCNFYWGMKMSQGKSKTMPMQIILGVEAVYYGREYIVLFAEYFDAFLLLYES